MFIDPEEAFKTIEKHWTAWNAEVKPKKYVIGISGGVDSTCAAALACKIFGPGNVVGVSLPCNGQADMDDVNAVFSHLGIARVTADIGAAFAGMQSLLAVSGLQLTEQCKTNMPARLRMTMLYGVAQCIDGAVVNTCNMSEDVCGYSTLFGDNAGSYAPLKNLTKTEVVALAKWLGVPESLACKKPIDGLQPLSDEEKLGFSYAVLDKYIRGGAIDAGIKKKIDEMHRKNAFKTEIVSIPGPSFPDAVSVF